MAEPTIICPKCKNEIKLTESLAAPLIESTRLDFEKRLAQKDLDVAGREKSIQEREAALSKAKGLARNPGGIERSAAGARKNRRSTKPKKPNLPCPTTSTKKQKRLPIFRKF
jgi:hypothetical protein